MRNAIESETLLLFEGNDHRNFFEAFRDHLAIPEMQIENYGGVSQGVWDFKHDGFSNVREFLSRLGSP